MANGNGSGRRMDRRAFVKGCVGAGVAGAAVAAGYSMAKPLSKDLGDTKLVEYIGSKKVGGPAPRGIPLLPLSIADDGVIRGQPTLAGETILDWYKYCGHEGAPGLQDSFRGDETLTYFVTPDKLAQGFDPWYRRKIGDTVNANDFQNVGDGAAVSWRSEGQSGNDIITAIIIRVDPEQFAFESVNQALVEEAGLASGFIAYVSFCTHFCCVPGWKEAEGQAKSVGAWDDIFCTCHLSQYDPFTLTQYDYLMLGGDAEEDGAGGGEH